ncbi:MAG: ATP-dependent DNA helicase RecG [bacterium]|nr:ATP-dependent DNA helicase RecG [bacterium]
MVERTNVSLNQSIDWNSSLEFQKGIGPQRWKVLKEANILTVKDLFLRFPKRYFDKTNIVPANQLNRFYQQTVSAIGQVKLVQEIPLRGAKHKKMLKVFLEDDTNAFQLIFYEGISTFISIFQNDQWFLITGKVTGSDHSPSFIHPRIEKLSQENIELNKHTIERKIYPIYQEKDDFKKVSLTSRGYQKLLERLYPFIDPPDTLPAEIRKRKHLPSLKQALKLIHFPTTINEPQIGLNYFIADELFYFQLALLARRKQSKLVQTNSIMEVGHKTKKLLSLLPFELTKGQRKVLNEIYLDLKQSRPMLRLLQGDVGSGKTIIALLTLCMVIESGYQGAFMVPTEVLAEQHYINYVEMLKKVGITSELLVSGISNTKRSTILKELENGKIDIVIGTHALIQEDVQFKNLGIAIIDEQHRFGVEQRKLLTDKGNGVHLLVMTATPIPRTLSLTIYGDLDVSTLTEKPANRSNIKTIAITPKQRKKVFNAVRENAIAGFQSYIVFPIVEESEALDLKSAVDEYHILKETEFKDISVGLLHGRMSLDEKNEVLKQFTSGKVQVLITTTVIEVGVDVPRATMIVIEHAERFGIAQLHQLRGRVGRSKYASKCILIVYQPNEVAKERIKAILNSQDGFELSEIDFKLRGSGELFGTRQHGLNELIFTDLQIHKEWVIEMRKEAELFLASSHQPESDMVWIELKRRYQEKMALGGIA